MSDTKSAKTPEQVPELQGSLRHTEIVDVLQFIHSSGKTGELLLKNLPDEELVRVYFKSGELLHAVRGDIEGMEALEGLPAWHKGDFLFLPDILTSKTTIDLSLHHVIMKVARAFDEKEHMTGSADEQSTQDRTGPYEERRNEMATLRELLEDLVNIEGINTAVLVGRDGFVIDGVVSGGRLEVEDIGAVISTGIGSSEVMGNELAVGALNTTMVEFDEGIVLVNLVGDNAILAVVADLKTPLGNVRYQVKKRLPDIKESLDR